MIGKDKTEMYKQRVIDSLDAHGQLAKSRIAHVCRIHLYDINALLSEMIGDKTIEKIQGTIDKYTLVDEDE